MKSRIFIYQKQKTEKIAYATNALGHKDKNTEIYRTTQKMLNTNYTR